MNMLMKTMAAGACALLLSTSFGVQTAEAGRNNGAGIAVGVATGLILGGILLNANRAHARPHVNYYAVDDGYEENCQRETYLVWQCYRDNRGRKHCSQVERLGRNVVCY
jgi:hypothetical protein